MTEWLIPCNEKYFRVEDAFKSLKVIDWRQTNNTKNVQVGDFIYIYISAPKAKIAYKGAVLAVNKQVSTYDDSAFSIPEGSYSEPPFMEVALFREFTIDGLDRESLKENGFPSNLMGATKVKDELGNYLHSKDRLQKSLDELNHTVSEVCLYPFPIMINEIGIDINIPLAPIKIEGSKATCGNCGEEFNIANRCTFCGQKLKQVSNEPDEVKEESEFQTILNQYEIGDATSWKEDIRGKLIKIFETKSEGTKYRFEINTEDNTGKIFELYQEESKTRIMGIKQMNKMLFDVFFKRDFYEFVSSKVELPEIRRERSGLVYMHLLPEKMWVIMCAITKE